MPSPELGGRQPEQVLTPLADLPDATVDPSDALITSPPVVDPDSLFRRQSPDLRRCGFINGNKDSEIRCSSQYSCAAPGTLGKRFGCCNEVSCDAGSGAITCVDPYSNICNGVGAADCAYMRSAYSIMSCQSACVTYMLRPSGQFVFESYTSWACGTTPATIVVLATTTDALPPDVPNGVGQTAIVVSTSIPGIGLTTTREVIGSGGTSQASSDSSNSGLNPGIIAAIIIGLVIVLIATIAIIWYCVQRSKRKRAEEAANISRRQIFQERGGVSGSERLMFSDGGHGQSTAQWVMFGQDDRRTVVG